MSFGRFDPRKARREPQHRVGHRIRVPEVRVVDANGEMLGVLTTGEAIKRARDQGMDLVEINPKAVPPVCKILDYGKFKYEEKKKKSETKRKQSVVEVKEVKLRPKTDDHDLDFKMRAARRFIEGGNKVKFTVRFRGREITHPEKAREQLDWICNQCLDIAVIETRPMMEARTMSMIIAPKTAVLQKLAETRAQQEKDRKAAEEARRAAKAAQPPGTEDDEDEDELDDSLEDELDDDLDDLDDDDDDDEDSGEE
jgi:translation initiation factor IF-3